MYIYIYNIHNNLIQKNFLMASDILGCTQHGGAPTCNMHVQKMHVVQYIHPCTSYFQATASLVGGLEHFLFLHIIIGHSHPH